MVLAQLPMKDLPFAQRVSKQFRAMIWTSRRLRQKLYMRPSDYPPDHAIACHNQATVSYLGRNALLVSRSSQSSCTYSHGVCFSTHSCALSSQPDNATARSRFVHLNIELETQLVKIDFYTPGQTINAFELASRVHQHS